MNVGTTTLEQSSQLTVPFSNILVSEGVARKQGVMRGTSIQLVDSEPTGEALHASQLRPFEQKSHQQLMETTIRLMEDNGSP